MRWLRTSPIDNRHRMSHVMAAPVVGEGILERLLAHDSTDTSGQAVKRVVATFGSARSDASAYHHRPSIKRSWFGGLVSSSNRRSSCWPWNRLVRR